MNETLNPKMARQFAELAHAGQPYDHDMPYSAHLDHVVSVLEQFGFTDPAMICAGYLHDVIEDTNRSYSDVKNRFGFEVAELVFAVTSERGRNRDERNKRTYPKIAGNPRAVALKLGDRIANVTFGAAVAETNSKYQMYKKEFASFSSAIRDADQAKEDPRITRMWTHLMNVLGLQKN